MEHFLELFVTVVLKVALPLIECSIKVIECRLKIIEVKRKALLHLTPRISAHLSNATVKGSS